MDTMIGIKAGQILKNTHKGTEIRATVLDNGIGVRWNSTDYKSMSAAGKAVQESRQQKGECNGWDFWKDATTGASLVNPNKRERSPSDPNAPKKTPVVAFILDPQAEIDRLRAEMEAKIKAVQDQSVGQRQRIVDRLESVSKQRTDMINKCAALEEEMGKLGAALAQIDSTQKKPSTPGQPTVAEAQATCAKSKMDPIPTPAKKNAPKK